MIWIILLYPAILRKIEDGVMFLVLMKCEMCFAEKLLICQTFFFFFNLDSYFWKNFGCCVHTAVCRVNSESHFCNYLVFDELCFHLIDLYTAVDSVLWGK